jgi:hypothetical protein
MRSKLRRCSPSTRSDFSFRRIKQIPNWDDEWTAPGAVPVMEPRGDANLRASRITLVITPTYTLYGCVVSSRASGMQ